MCPYVFNYQFYKLYLFLMSNFLTLENFDIQYFSTSLTMQGRLF